MISEALKFYAVVLALVAVFFILGLLWRRIDAYLSIKIGIAKWDAIKDYAELCVRAIEQNPAFQDLAGYLKKENVMIQIFDFAVKKGIQISDLDRDKIVEAAVGVMNSEKYADVFDYVDEVLAYKIGTPVVAPALG